MAKQRQITFSREIRAFHLPKSSEPKDEHDLYDEGNGAFSGSAGGTEVLQRVLKQVHAIAEAVAKGKDRQARRFLRDLITDQLQSGGEQYAVKSLCNIAQRCAGMFRPDFERACLTKALELNPSDPWTLVQWGNHLKSVGQYDDAIHELSKAQFGEHERVALSSIADVWSQSGDYTRAIEIYESIPDWEHIIKVRTALADVLRRAGRLEETEQEYARILTERRPDADRALAGMAEIARRRGDIGLAIEQYDRLIDDQSLDWQSYIIYRLAKCSLLKQANRLDEALRLADDIVHDAPFSMAARITRGSILGLLGKELRGLEDIRVQEHAGVFGEWIRHYYGGLLLLKLERFKEARQQLVDHLQSALLSRDSQVLVRLGAAFNFLAEDGIEAASAELDRIDQIDDCFARYVHDVLCLHVAVARHDAESVRAIAAQLKEACERDQGIADAVTQLWMGNLQAARVLEIGLLLRLAA